MQSNPLPDNNERFGKSISPVLKGFAQKLGDIALLCATSAFSASLR